MNILLFYNAALFAAMQFCVCHAAPPMNGGNEFSGLMRNGWNFGLQGRSSAPASENGTAPTGTGLWGVSNEEIVAGRAQFLQVLKSRIPVTLQMQNFVNWGGLDGFIRAAILTQRQTQMGMVNNSQAGPVSVPDLPESNGGDLPATLPGSDEPGADVVMPSIQPEQLEVQSVPTNPILVQTPPGIGQMQQSNAGNINSVVPQMGIQQANNNYNPGIGERVLNRLLAINYTMNRRIQNFITQIRDRMAAARMAITGQTDGMNQG